MCGRFNNHLPKMIGWTEMLNEWPEVRLSYNLAPSMRVAAFAPSEQSSSSYSGATMRWGMVPSWAKAFDSKYATFNARVETITEKPTFRSAWRNQQRCLVPMAGYYEWQAQQGGKQPFYISDRNVGGLVAAGLYEDWTDGNNSHQSCTVITRAADPGLDRIHGRMPVLLTPESASEWMSVPSDHAAELLVELKSPDVVYWPVSKSVGSTRNDHEGLPEPIDREPEPIDREPEPIDREPEPI